MKKLHYIGAWLAVIVFVCFVGAAVLHLLGHPLGNPLGMYFTGALAWATVAARDFKQARES
jgi:hypothetical protein